MSPSQFPQHCYTESMEKISQQKGLGADTNKQSLWEKQISLLNKIGKEDLPIDTEELTETLAALNLSGIPTIASNAGHAIEERHTGDTAYPWVLISTDQDKNNELSAYARIQTFLMEFYKDRQATDDIRLRAGDVFENQFILSSMDEALLEKDSSADLTEEEKNSLIEALPERQQEMYAFGQFLKFKFLASNT